MRQVSGVLLLVSRYVQPNTIWALDKSTSCPGVRDDAQVKADIGLFTRTARRESASWAFPHPGVVKITLV